MAEYSIRPTNPDDLVIWPDGTKCMRYELPDFQHMSDDYEIVPHMTPRWHELCGGEDET